MMASPSRAPSAVDRRPTPIAIDQTALVDAVVEKLGARIDQAVGAAAKQNFRMRRLTEAMLEISDRLEQMEQSNALLAERLAHAENAGAPRLAPLSSAPEADMSPAKPESAATLSETDTAGAAVEDLSTALKAANAPIEIKTLAAEAADAKYGAEETSEADAQQKPERPKVEDLLATLRSAREMRGAAARHTIATTPESTLQNAINDASQSTAQPFRPEPAIQQEGAPSTQEVFPNATRAASPPLKEAEAQKPVQDDEVSIEDLFAAELRRNAEKWDVERADAEQSAGERREPVAGDPRRRRIFDDVPQSQLSAAADGARLDALRKSWADDAAAEETPRKRFESVSLTYLFMTATAGLAAAYVYIISA